MLYQDHYFENRKYSNCDSSICIVGILSTLIVIPYLEPKDPSFKYKKLLKNSKNLEHRRYFMKIRKSEFFNPIKVVFKEANMKNLLKIAYNQNK